MGLELKLVSERSVPAVVAGLFVNKEHAYRGCISLLQICCSALQFLYLPRQHEALSFHCLHASIHTHIKRVRKSRCRLFW